MGLAAAMTVQRACNEVTMPALEMEMLCCSMASWMLVLSWSFICTTQGITGGLTTLIKAAHHQELSPRAYCIGPEPHLVKLINETHATVGQNQGSGL